MLAAGAELGDAVLDGLGAVYGGDIGDAETAGAMWRLIHANDLRTGGAEAWHGVVGAGSAGRGSPYFRADPMRVSGTDASASVRTSLSGNGFGTCRIVAWRVGVPRRVAVPGIAAPQRNSRSLFEKRSATRVQGARRTIGCACRDRAPQMRGASRGDQGEERRPVHVGVGVVGGVREPALWI